MAALFSVTVPNRLILASASPRRRQFLHEWGVPFAVRPVAGEPDPVAGESAQSFVVRSALYKLAAATAQSGPGDVVLVADTVVALGGRIMGKPADRAEALGMLESLAGRDHQVITAAAFALPDKTVVMTMDVCHVHFLAWDRAVLQAYVNTGECDDKAGAYAIQGTGAFLVERIDGSWSTVVGLPVTWLARELCRKGVLVPAGQ